MTATLPELLTDLVGHELVTDIIADPPTPEQLHRGHEGEECHRTPLAHFTAGQVTAVVERFDWWDRPGGCRGESFIQADIDFPNNRVGFADIEIDEEHPDSISSLPDIATVVTAVHRFIAEWIAYRSAVSA